MLCRGHLVNSNLEKKFSKYESYLSFAGRAEQNSSCSSSLLLGQARFPHKSFGWDFLSFQRDSKDFWTLICTFFYTIWLEFSRKKLRTDRMHCLCQEPSNLESSKKMDDLKIPKKKKNWSRMGISKQAEENECSESRVYQIICKMNQPKT